MKTNLTLSLLPATIMLVSLTVYAQKEPPKNWQHLDQKSDKVWGVSTEKALRQFIANPANPPLIVAVIDGGTAMDHEDLQGCLWMNPGEIPDNGKDDDNNGYIDDVYGWNFIGGPGGDVEHDTYEFTRVLAAGRKGEALNSPEDQKLLERAKILYDKNFKESSEQYRQFQSFHQGILDFIRKTGVDRPTFQQVKAVPASNAEEKQMRMIAGYVVLTGGADSSPIMHQIAEMGSHFDGLLKKSLNLDYEPRAMVGDRYADVQERYYGNNHIDAPNTEHGTHVAGIIAAARNNETGIDGICDRCKILTVRTVPNGDERDKDVANAIRYAVDNGARVINMSFGKALSPHKQVVDEAVKYALDHDVLLVHAAGNDNEDISSGLNYPNPYFQSTSQRAPNWVEVGASSWQKKKGRVAAFSNYSKERVDVFAPSVAIYSLKPGNGYVSEDGTSMAAPVVAGVAALIRQRYPQLKAGEVRQILLQSAVKCKERVTLPGTKKRIRMKELCVSGGIVNAYQALDLAERVTKGTVKLGLVN